MYGSPSSPASIGRLHEVHLKEMHVIVVVAAAVVAVVVLVGDLTVGRPGRRQPAGAHRRARQDVAIAVAVVVLVQQRGDEVLLLLMVVVELHGAVELLVVAVLLPRLSERECHRPRRRLALVVLLQAADGARG